MKNQIKKMLLLVTAIVALTVCTAFGVSALDVTGQCGDNVYWSYNDGELKIIGQGEMWDYNEDLIVGSGDDAPFYQEDFNKVVISDGVTYIGNSAFAWCRIEDIDIPDSVTKIGKQAFTWCGSLTNITIPDSVKEIGSSAFSSCGDLRSVTLPKSINKMGSGVFYCCGFLDKVVLPDGLTEIADYMFYSCGAETIVIPASVKKIGFKAIADCGVEDIYYTDSETEWNRIEFDEHNYLENVTIHFNHKHIDLTSDGICDDCTATVGVSHTHTYASAVTKSATCTATGTTTYTCSCGDTYTETIKAKGHTSDKGTVTKNATYKATGTKTYKCTACKQVLKTEEIARLTLSKVSGLKASSIKTTSIKFTWSKVTGAEKYEVYYSTNGKSWKKVTATKNSVTIKKLKSGTTYKVKVRAVAGSNKGSYSSVLITSTKPVKATLSTLKSTKKKQAVATWKTISGVTGYEVTYSTSKKFTKKTTKTITVKKAKTKKTTLKKLKSGKKYYVKVRAYKTVNGKRIYGAYSSVKTVKVK